MPDPGDGGNSIVGPGLALKSPAEDVHYHWSAAQMSVSLEAAKSAAIEATTGTEQSAVRTCTHHGVHY